MNTYKTTLLLGIITLITAKLSQTASGQVLDIIRIAAGAGFFLTCGLPYLEIILKKSGFKCDCRIFLTIIFSLLLLYPTGVINIVIEGKQDIYREHLTGVAAILLAISVLGIALSTVLKVKPEKIQIDKRVYSYLTIILLAGLTLRVLTLSGANLNGDEVNLGAQTYDLVDGMVAGRNAYFISETGHSPLGFFISHAFYNLFEPGGFYAMKDWMLRIPQVIMGVIAIFGTFVLSKKFLDGKSRYLPLLPAGIVAIDSYSNFGSRLAIFQDLSTFAVFVTAFLLSFYLFYKNKNFTFAIVLGISFGALLLVKFTGILFLPMFLLLIKEWKKSIISLATAFAIFTPVIIYNIAAYLTTGFMDVPFSKLANMIGIPAKSIMNFGANDSIYGGSFGSPISTLLEMPSMLLDQWGIALSTIFLASIFSGIYFLKKSKILYLAIVLSVIFFALNGFRTYYFPYLSIIFAVLAALNFQYIKRKKLAAMMLSLAAIFTIFFNINTNILLKEPEVMAEYGRSGEMTPFNLTYSLGASSFLSDQGWDELQPELESPLILDEKLNKLSAKWYLHINDEIRRFYGDENYVEAYEYMYLSDWTDEKGTLISTSPKDLENEKIIKDRHGNTEFYIYFLK